MDRPTVQQPANPLANYQFSADELRVLRECNTESFFQRSLPLAIGFGATTYLGANFGYIRTNAKYGAWPIVVMSSVIGYFMGKFSYQQKCAEKLMQLPNSKIAEILRARKQGSILDNFSQDRAPGFSLAPFKATTEDIYTDDENFNSDRLFADAESRPENHGLDDIYRPSIDSNSSYYDAALALPQAKQQGTSYDELRELNREKYKNTQKSFVMPPMQPEKFAAPHSDRSKILSEPESEQIFDGKKNKYGDSWSA